MATTNLGSDELYMGFVAEGLCSDCSQPTFAADGLCYQCKVEEAEQERLYFKSPLGLECE